VYNPECLVPTEKHEGGSVMTWAAVSWYYAGPVITHHGRITAHYFQTTMKFSKTTMQLELFRHGLKSMKVNFSIFPGQHSHQISTILNHSGQFWRLERGKDVHFQQLCRNLKMFFEKNGVKLLRNCSKLV
jgi:hypothetical protein